MTHADAHWVTVLIILFTTATVPFYWFFVLPPAKAATLAWITAAYVAALTTATLWNITARLGPPGGALIAILWILPPLITWRCRRWFGTLNQRPIVALQVFRIIGGVFIIEMARGHLPPIFALPAGIGDICTGLLALALLIPTTIPRAGIVALLILGTADFAVAFFFGFTSSTGPAQLFARGFESKLNHFPTGLIPIVLVPVALTYHTLSLIALRQPTTPTPTHITRRR